MAITPEQLDRYLEAYRHYQQLAQRQPVGAVGDPVARAMSRIAQRMLKKEEATVSSTDLNPSVVFHPNHTGPIKFIVIGCGGTGARVVPPLMQMLRPNDSIYLIDPDIVKDRNLARQHFTERDIGLSKAVVLANRYRRGELTPVAYQASISTDLIRDVLSDRTPVIMIGCVDNLRARQAILNVADWIYSWTRAGCAYIDGGNATRDGQVIMSLFQWPGSVAATFNNGTGILKGTVTLPGLVNGLPQLLRQSAAEEDENCETRIDLQTVQVNMMSASFILNLTSMLMLNMSMTTCGAFFSTMNAAQPIMMAKAFGQDSPSLVIMPDTAFAQEASGATKQRQAEKKVMGA